jgi:hypothetical protein
LTVSANASSATTQTATTAPSAVINRMHALELGGAAEAFAVQPGRDLRENRSPRHSGRPASAAELAGVTEMGESGEIGHHIGEDPRNGGG